MDNIPTVDRIVAECNRHDAFSRADPLVQVGAPGPVLIAPDYWPRAVATSTGAADAVAWATSADPVDAIWIR